MPERFIERWTANGTRRSGGAAQAARLGLRLAGALAAAHARGVVHRDSKRGNALER